MTGGAGFEEGRLQGQLEAQIQEHDRRLSAINGSIDRMEGAANNLTTTVAAGFAEIKTKIAFHAAMGAGIASVVVSVATALIVYFVIPK